MKKLLGILLFIGGIVLGFYVGGYLCFVKGIIQVIQGVTPIIVPTAIAWGIAKIFFASLIGAFCALVPCALGGALLTN